MQPWLKGTEMKTAMISLLLFGLATAGFITPALADVGTLSRANCLGTINESVTYDRPLFRQMVGFTASVHTQLGNTEPLHVLVSDMLPSWRFYAGDTGDGGTLLVSGTHGWVIQDEQGAIIDEGYRETGAVDCNLTEW